MLEFLVKGSEPQPYKVVFQKKDNNLTAWCTCKAAKFGQYCHHRFDILSGRRNDIVSDNKEEVDTVREWLTGTDIEKMLLEVIGQEKICEVQKNKLTDCKKRLARALID